MKYQLLIVLSFVFQILAYTQSSTSQIDSIVQAGIQAKAYPGAVVLVANRDSILFQKAYGFHTYDHKRAVQKSDIYDLASITKVTTALAALMKLQGEGKFDLDAPLERYFPKFKKTNKANLTFREMLAHQAQLKPWIPYWQNTLRKNGKFKWRTFKNKPSKRFPIEVTDNLYLHRKYKNCIFKAIEDSPLEAEKKYLYSGLLFYLLPDMVERMTGQDYETYLKENFYQPIGANTLTYNPLRFFPKERIVPTERDTFFRKTQIHGRVHDEGAAMMNGVSGNAGLFANAEDLSKLAQLYLNKGNWKGQQLIAANAVEEFTHCQFCETGNRRGLGFDKPMIEYVAGQSSVAEAVSPESFGHSGYTGTFMWIDPTADLIYIFLSNRVYPTRDNRKLYQMDIRPSIQKVVYEVFLD